MSETSAGTRRRPPRRRPHRSPAAVVEREAPPLSYPPQLPVSQHRDEILAAIRDHQVVILAGETGSGKTTQLPKMCLELGRGRTRLIGHTQPRRIAARAVAERVADELGVELGTTVGYAVRFTDRVSEASMVKLMTDGILLAELQRDRMLSRYDTLIIDEAHERSLTIDFILGYLKTLLPRRPDLKVVITSATIDPQRFSRHFDGAPVIEVSGRMFPVEVRYRPLTEEHEPDDDDLDEPLDDEADPRSARRPAVAPQQRTPQPERDQTTGICDAVTELLGEGPGDILVFLSGEREIRDTAEAIAAMELRATEVVPLYARLSAAEQHRVFSGHTGRRIVLSTNVAETSLTVPGIRFVIDTGRARISRYSHRTKVQRLPIEAISQASANQRKGRCGRVADGICIRLYGEDDFLARPEFTDPEILRTNLASVILQMTSLGLGDVAAFPFLEPPDRRQVTDGTRLLEELGALDPAAKGRLTPTGRALASLPVDPRLGRMILEADRNGCVHEVLVITAALSIQDPRERPLEHQQAADEKHTRFRDKDSDFLAYLNLWHYLAEQQRELSGSAFRRLCKAEYLHYLRVREWQDLFSQLRQVVKSLGIVLNTVPADPQRIHQSLLAGLLSHVGLKDGATREYLGARSAKFVVWPGSALARKPPQWLMVGELVETSRLWGRVAAKVEPEWAEALAPHLVKRTYSEPHWERKQGAVMAYERVTLYGVPLVASRKVSYAKVDPELCRDLFMRNALVEGDWSTHHAFFAANRALLEDVEDLENRARRRDIVVDDETLVEFYDRRLPPHVVSGRHFDSWWKRARHQTPELLTFSTEMLLTEQARNVTAADYPDTWQQVSLVLPLSYQFEPGADADGVTVHLPLAVLNQLSGDGFDWQVPGLRLELVTALVKSLPKPVRRLVVPAPDVARAVLDRLGAPEGVLTGALARELRALRGVHIEPHDWDLARVPDHLRMTFRVEDAAGAVVAEGKDLDALRRQLAPSVRATLAQASPRIERTALTGWTIGDLPRSFETSRAGHRVKGYPALVDRGGAVDVRVLVSERDQAQAMRLGTRRLLLLAVSSPLKAVVRTLPNDVKLTFSSAPHPSVPALLEDCVACAVDSLVEDAGGPAWSQEGFAALQRAVAAGLVQRTREVVEEVAAVLAAGQAAARSLRATTSLAVLPSLTDARAQLAALLLDGFVATSGYRRLGDLARYVRALQRRLEALPANPARDRERLARVDVLATRYTSVLATLPPERREDDDVREVRWMLEELRVSFFAQQLGTPYPVSEKRVTKALDALA